MNAGRAILGGARRWLASLGDLLLPETCRGCGAEFPAAKGLCEACSVRLLLLVSLRYCRRCGSTLGPNIPRRDDGCDACPDPLPRYARVFRLGPYAEPLRSAIRGLKYRRRDGSACGA